MSTNEPTGNEPTAPVIGEIVDTPSTTKEPTKTETPAKTETPSKTEAPAKTEAPTKTEASAKTETPAETEAPPKTHASLDPKTTIKTEPMLPNPDNIDQASDTIEKEPVAPVIGAVSGASSDTVVPSETEAQSGTETPSSEKSTAETFVSSLFTLFTALSLLLVTL